MVQRLKKPLILSAAIGFAPVIILSLLGAFPLSENSGAGFFFGLILMLISLYYMPIQIVFGLPRHEPSDFYFAAGFYFAIAFVISMALIWRTENSSKPKSD